MSREATPKADQLRLLRETCVEAQAKPVTSAQKPKREQAPKCKGAKAS